MLRLALVVMSLTSAAAGLIGFDLIGPFSTDTAKAVFLGSLSAVVVLLTVQVFVGRGQMAEPL